LFGLQQNHPIFCVATTLTVRFFLINRELASLVLDHLDHETIGTFRLICKAANACATAAFVRTSTRARLSEFSMGSFAREHTKHCVGCYPGSSHISCQDLSPQFMKDKMAHWETIVVESLPGLLEFSRLLATNKALVAPRVATVCLAAHFIDHYVVQFPPFPPYEDVHPGSWAFMVFASRVNPRNLCIGKHDRDWFTYNLSDFVAAWPLENVAWHWMITQYTALVRNVPRHHVFCQREVRESPDRREIYPHPPNDVVGVQTIAYHNRPIRTYFYAGGTEHKIPSDHFEVAKRDREIMGPGDVQYRFPTDAYWDCPFCGFEV